MSYFNVFSSGIDTHMADCDRKCSTVPCYLRAGAEKSTVTGEFTGHMALSSVIMSQRLARSKYPVPAPQMLSLDDQLIVHLYDNSC